MLHDTMLKDDSYHTGTAKSPVWKDKECVSHILLHCSRFVRARSELGDSVEDIQYAKSNCSGVDKVAFMIAPSCSNNVSKKYNIIIEDALFQFISRNSMKL